MTKLKNTKKGMAKKALSISLVAAMLATSNVPVWAAEDIFSDNSAAVEAEAPVDDVDVFSEAPTEDVAPVIEETEDAIQAKASATTGNEFSVALTPFNYDNKAVENNTIIWGKGDLTADLTVTDNQIVDGVNLYAAWKLNGEIVTGTETSLTAGTTLPCKRTINVDHANGKLELFVYAMKGDSRVWSYTSDTINVKAKELSDIVSKVEFTDTAYTGAEQRQEGTITLNKDITDTAVTNFNNYNVAYTGDLKNVTDDGVTVTLTPGENLKGYSGQLTGTYKITPMELDSSTDIQGRMTATLTNTNYVFTGNKTSKIKAADIKLIDTTTKADLSGYLDVDKDGYVGVTLAQTAVGSKDKIRVNIIKGLPASGSKNYEITDNNPSIQADNDMTIVARDLSTVTATVPNQSYTGSKVVIDPDDVKFVDKTSNEELTLGAVEVTVPDNAINRGDGYVATIKPAAANKNITGTTTGTFSIYSENIGAAEFANEKNLPSKCYTGEAVTFTASELGALTIKKGSSTTSTPIEPSDYEISYENNINAGIATLVVKGKNSYAGSRKTISFNIAPASVSSITKNTEVELINASDAKDYKAAMNVVVKAKNTAGKEFTLTEGADYSVEYSFDESNKVGEKVVATITVTNPNFKGTSSVSTVVSSSIAAAILKPDYIKLKETNFVYNGKPVTPEFDIVIGGKVINPAYYEASYTNNVNAGTATLTVTGDKKNYSGTAKIDYTITPANANTLKGVIPTEQYRGYSIEVSPDKIDLTLNGEKVDVASNFNLSFGENLNIGEGTVTLTPKNGNFTGTKTLTFQITGELLAAGGTFKYLDKDGFDVTAKKNDLFTYDGSAHTFDKVKFGYTKTLVEGTDYELKYVDNVYGKKDANGKQQGAVLAIAIGKYGSAGVYTDADGNKYTNVIKADTFEITQQGVNESNVTVSNGSYAAGLPVKPEVSIIVKGVKLVEGKDYDLNLAGNKDLVNATAAKTLTVTIEFKNGYKYNGTATSGKLTTNWGIDKFNLANADVSVKDGKLVVKCGRVDIEAAEYTTTTNTDGTITITAVSTSKNYTGTKTVKGNGETDAERPVAPVISAVNVKGNKATIVLAGESNGATGYDYVISKSNVFTDKASRVDVKANVLTTETTFQYVNQGVYYAYLHSWKRVDGKKVFSGWSNAYPFMISSITPEQPTVTSVKVTGKTVKVTYTKSANATGYDLVLGSKVKKVNGEKRPVEYGKLVKKVYKGNTVTATFTNVPKGTYYAGLHAYNRTSENNGKVFSPWSNTKKVTVK
ncbi:hypothetical protein NXH76_14950 [Blautia schinkii]|nr:hypothetical protein [Blautia schinkii]